jgi:cytochrome P450
MKSINTSAKASKINVSDIDFTKLVTSELLHSALKETLRLQAHNLSPRQLEEDTIIKIQGKDYLLKKGTMSFAPSTLVNWNADIYEDPMTWKAGRFLDEVQEGCSPENTKDVKYDKKKLKIPLLIFGAGTHAV